MSAAPHSKTWLAFVFLLGLLASLLPLYGYLTYRAALQAGHQPYTETIQSPRVVEGQVSRLQVEPGEYRVSYLYPTLDRDGDTAWYSQSMAVEAAIFETLQQGQPISVVYSTENPRTAYLRDEVLAPPVQVPWLVALLLALLAANGVGLVAWAVWQFGSLGQAASLPRPPDALGEDVVSDAGPSRPLSLIVVGGWASLLAFGEFYLLSRILAINDIQTAGTLLWLVSTPGLAVPWRFRPFGGHEAGIVAISAAYWFVLGAAIALAVRRNWLRVGAWLLAALITMAVGFYLLVLAISQSGP